MRISRPLLLISILFALFGCSNRKLFFPSNFEQSLERPHAGVAAPDFELPALNGTQTALSEHRGRVLLLNFWATWCFSCQTEIPAMEQLSRRYESDGLSVIGVFSEPNDPDVIRNELLKYQLTFPVLVDRKQTVRANYEIRGLPTTYVINRQGEILGRIPGAMDWESPEASEFIESFL